MASTENRLSPPKSGRRPPTSAKRVRSAMGEYQAPSGGRPLSAQYYPTPGPADYFPPHKKDSRRYSLKGRLYPLTKPPMPAPSDYDTDQDLVWMGHKTTTLKPKGLTWPYDTRKNAELTYGPGAGHYYRKDGDTGSGTKRAVSARHREGLHAGYPNMLVQPVDTLGFSTPGPLRFRPESVRGPKHFIGTQLTKNDGDTLGPGPAAYNLPQPIPPAPVIGEKFNLNFDPDYPAPNNYELPSAIGSIGGKTFGVCLEDKTPQESPFGNHSLAQPKMTSHTLTYRAFPQKIEQRPCSADYRPTDHDLPHAPNYSCRPHCMPVFPDVLLYPEHATLNLPGPGRYESDREFEDNSNPAYSIGLPRPQKPNANPAPNQYRVQHSSLSTQPAAPSYTLRPASGNYKEKERSPGPAAYHPRPTTAGGPGCSITPKRSRRDRSSTGPSPSAYAVKRGTTNKGKFTGPAATMKGRHTPARYSGFPSSYLTALQSLS